MSEFGKYTRGIALASIFTALLSNCSPSSRSGNKSQTTSEPNVLTVGDKITKVTDIAPNAQQRYHAGFKPTQTHMPENLCLIYAPDAATNDKLKQEITGDTNPDDSIGIVLSSVPTKQGLTIEDSVITFDTQTQVIKSIDVVTTIKRGFYRIIPAKQVSPTDAYVVSLNVSGDAANDITVGINQ